VVVIINPMIGVVVVVEASRGVVMATGFSGMGVQETVVVLVYMFVKVGMFHIAMPMCVIVQVVVLVAVFVFMLQGADGAAAVLPVGVRQTVETTQAVVLQKCMGGHIFQDLSLVHHQGSPGQRLDKKDVVADQQQGDVKIPQDFQQQFFSPGVQTGRGFVQDKQSGLHGQHAGQGQAFAFTAGHVQGNPFFKTFQVDHGKHPLQSLADLGA